MTAMAATVGTGNIVGVATAIAAGGPGALFWMWMTGLVGMATKYSEALLSVKYRRTNPNGTQAGGPMYYLREGLRWRGWAKVLGGAFAVFTAAAAFGIGNMAQSNSVAAAMNRATGAPPWVTGLIVAGLLAAVTLGGIRAIGRFTGAFVPVMIVVYMAGSGWILLAHWTRIPAALALIFESAFTGTAAAGGFLGAGVMQAMRFGVARGIFSNESGLGSAGIAAAAAHTAEPVRQALVSMTQTFIDTLVVCTMTGLCILVTGAWQSGCPAPPDATCFRDGTSRRLGLVDRLDQSDHVRFLDHHRLELLRRPQRRVPAGAAGGDRVSAAVSGRRICRSGLQPGVRVGAKRSAERADGMPNLIGLILLSGVIVRETKSLFP
jgi:alanine or glycine:cation symporter, AGCS family